MAFSKRSITAKYMGEEPDPNDWDGLSSEELKSRIHEAFRWYYRFYDFKESMEFVQAYYKKNKVKSKSPGKLKINDFKLKAKIDTGARSSSIHATNIQIYQKGKIERVKFQIFQSKSSF